MSTSHPVCTKTFRLSNGQNIPAVGLGTWQGGFGSEDEKKLEATIIHALKSGYRLIDTAQYYGVEPIVGRAIRNSGIPRSEITLITKFWGEWHANPAEALRISLRDLNVGYIDILLMHWPWATGPPPERKVVRKHESPTFLETWKSMEKLVGEECRAIGVSNFYENTLEELLAVAEVKPVVNQVEINAFNPNLRLVPYCQSKEIHVMSWSTMGGERDGDANLILTHDFFKDLAKKYGTSTGVISLSWAVQRGITVIPKSSSPSRIEQNIKLVELDDGDMAKMNDVHNTIRKHRVVDDISALWMEVDGRETLQGWTRVEMGFEDEDGNWLT